MESDAKHLTGKFMSTGTNCNKFYRHCCIYFTDYDSICSENVIYFQKYQEEAKHIFVRMCYIPWLLFEICHFLGQCFWYLSLLFCAKYSIIFRQCIRRKPKRFGMIFSVHLVSWCLQYFISACFCLVYIIFMQILSDSAIE